MASADASHARRNKFSGQSRPRGQGLLLLPGVAEEEEEKEKGAALVVVMGRTSHAKWSRQGSGHSLLQVKEKLEALPSGSGSGEKRRLPPNESLDACFPIWLGISLPAPLSHWLLG
jgi:hypothetical protein